MDIQTLLNSLTADGFQLAARDGDKLAILGPVAKLTPKQKASLGKHKSTLLGLLPPAGPAGCIPLEKSERDAIRWADTPAADEALELALVDWDDLEPYPPACDICGSIVFRWDAKGERHCIVCSPGQSERLAKLAAKLKKEQKSWLLLQQPLDE